MVNTTPKQYNLTESLGKSSQNILYNAFYLAKQKVKLSGSEYKQLVKEWGWDSEDKKYLKVAKTFEKFSPLDLAKIEPDTLFLLSKNNKKYANVIEQLLDIGSITQEKVRELIKQQRQHKASKSEKSTIWRRTNNGSRYCQVPPIHDQKTGVALQEMMDSEGKSAQQIVAEAIALRQAMKEGRLDWVSNSQHLDVETVEISTSESLNNVNQQVTDEYNSDNELIIEIDDFSVIEDCTIISDNINLNPVSQETTKSLSEQLFTIVEHINYFGKKQIKEVELLIKNIISCNSQPILEQWNRLAEFTRRNIKTLTIVIIYSGKEHQRMFEKYPGMSCC